MSQQATVISTLVDIIAAPKQAIANIEDNNKWMWVPLLALLAFSAMALAYYYQTVDIEWMVDQIFAASEEPMPEEARAFMTKSTMMIGGMVSIFIMIPIIFAVYALYLHLTDKITGDGKQGFSSWFSLSVWASFPSIISPIASMIILVMSGSDQISMDEMNFLTANAVFTHYPMGHPAMAFMSSITPFMFWTIGLVGLGISYKTKRTIGKSIFIAAVPYILIYGIWGALVLG